MDCGSEVLNTERQKAGFSSKWMSELLFGVKKLEQLDKVYNMISSDPTLCEPMGEVFDFTREKARERTMAKIIRFYELRGTIHDEEIKKLLLETMSFYDESFAMRLGVHNVLFRSAIEGQGTDAQKKQYLPAIDNLGIFGCFGMTELGNGSYIQHFETTAVFDAATDSFVLNSPTITSTKWWIGMAAQTATHCIVFARLIIAGNDYGVHSFIAPIRDPSSGRPLPNVILGDVGAKMGRHGLDNGYIRFHHHSVPRENMLMRWAKVSAKGEYEPPPKKQLAYGALIHGRVVMISASAMIASKGLTIAIRYGAQRRQFNEKDKGILDYGLHKREIMPNLATCYALFFMSQKMQKQYDEMKKELQQGDLSSLSDVHNTSAGLKAVFTWWCASTLEICRQSLGGHGYSAYSHIPSILADFVVYIPGEGNNPLLCQQTARYLITSYQKSLQGVKLRGHVQYLQHPDDVLQETCQIKDSNITHEQYLSAAVYLSTRLITGAASKLSSRLQHSDMISAWNDTMVELIECTKAHSYLVVIQNFVLLLDSLTASPPPSQKVTSLLPVLRKLCDLFSLCHLEKYFAVLLQNNYISGHQVDIIREVITARCDQIRNDSISLVDAFYLPDFLLNSPLGCHDGGMYERYLQVVNSSPQSPQAPYWDKLIKPVLLASQSKL